MIVWHYCFQGVSQLFDSTQHWVSLGWLHEIPNGSLWRILVLLILGKIPLVAAFKRCQNAWGKRNL